MKKRKKVATVIPPQYCGGIQNKKTKNKKNTSISATIIGRLPSAWTAKKVSALATLSATRGGFTGHAIVSFKLVADPEMRRLNRTYRNKDKTTDVLSFSYKNLLVAPSVIARSGATKQSQPLELGDIVISLPQVTRQAKAIGRPIGDEFALMIVHGILHILGHDHETLPQETKMFALQHNILSEAKIL